MDLFCCIGICLTLVKIKLKESWLQILMLKKHGKVTELSKLYSDGSYYTYEKEDGQLRRTSVILAFSDGMKNQLKKLFIQIFNLIKMNGL